MKKDIDEEIVEWSIKAFPDLTVEKQLLKLSRELKELIDCLIAGDEESSTEELADVYIVSCILKKRFNDSIGGYFFSLIKETRFDDVEPVVKEKMKKNKERKWIKLDDGTYQHEE